VHGECTHLVDSDGVKSLHKKIICGVLVASLIGAHAAAHAATVVAGKCEDLSGSPNQNSLGDGNTDRCLFDGNINGNSNAGNQNSFLSAQASYNALSLGDITLDYITQSDAGNFSSFGTFTGANAVSGTYNLPGFALQFLAVKAGNQFYLYQLDGQSSGTFTTQGLNNSRGQAQGLSHLAFFGARSAVPEPGTWAMMLIGFGAVGHAMRRRPSPRPQLV
jgi:hypothetical protein